MIPTPSPRTTAAGLLAVVAAAMASPPPVGADRYVATNGPRWLVLVDDLHLDFRRTGQIRETLAAAVRPIVLSGVLLRLGTSGPSAVRLRADEDTSWNAVTAPLRQVTGNGLKAEDIVRMRDTAAGRRELAARARATVTTARRLLGAAANRPAVLLLVSHGYRTDVPEVSAEITELAALAGRARVPIVVLDPQRDPPAGAAPPGHAALPLAFHHAATETSLALLAQQTGGAAWDGGNSLVTVISRLR